MNGRKLLLFRIKVPRNVRIRGNFLQQSTKVVSDSYFALIRCFLEQAINAGDNTSKTGFAQLWRLYKWATQYWKMIYVEIKQIIGFWFPLES